MATRATWRPTPWMWVALGVLALAAVHVASPARLHGRSLLVTSLVVAVGVLAVRRLWMLPPVVTMCGAIVLTIFSGAWRQIGLGGLPLDRLLLVIVPLQFLLRAPGVAAVPPLQIRRIHLLMAVTIMYAFASAQAAGTLGQETSQLTLIDQFGAIPFIAFLLAPSVFHGQRERNILLSTLVGLGAYLGLTAVFEALGPHALVFPRYILNVDAALPGERAGGPFQSSVAEGFATFACAGAAGIAYVIWRGRTARIAAAAVAVVCLFGCFLTLERGVWIGALVGAVIAALLTRDGRRWVLPSALAGALALGLVLAASSGLAHKASSRVEDERSIWDRQNQVSAGMRMVAAKPLFGFGWNTYTGDDLEYFRQAFNYPMVGYSLSTYTSIGKLLPLHETYLGYAVELGVLGLALWLATFFWGVGSAVFSPGPSSLRLWKLGLFAAAVCFFAIGLVNPLQSPFSVLLLWTWAGVAQGRRSVPVGDYAGILAAGMAA